MAVKEFNMNKIKRTFWPFTLKDKKDENGNVVEKGQKKFIVRMPQKGVFEAIKDVEANGTGEDADTSTNLQPCGSSIKQQYGKCESFRRRGRELRH